MVSYHNLNRATVVALNWAHTSIALLFALTLWGML